MRVDASIASLFVPPAPITASGWPLLDRALRIVRLWPGAHHDRRRRGAGAGRARASAASRAGAASDGPLHAGVRAVRDDARDRSCSSCSCRPASRAAWVNAPLAGLAQHLAAPSWARDVVAFALVVAAVLMLAPAAHAALDDAEQMLQRLSAAGDAVGRSRRAPHAVRHAGACDRRVGRRDGPGDPRQRGRVTWLARAYAIAIAATVVLKAATLVRLRRARAGALSFKVPLNLQLAGRDLPIGLIGPAWSLAPARSSWSRPATARRSPSGGPERADLLFVHGPGSRRRAWSKRRSVATPSICCPPPSCRSIRSTRGPATCWCRPQSALARPRGRRRSRRRGDRDVVVMTVRLLGVDVAADASSRHHADARRAAALSRRSSRSPSGIDGPVRLLIVPAHNVFDAIVATILRLRSSDVYVGESSTLSADEQARLLGEAWERAGKPEDARRPARHLSPQRPHRRVSPRRASAVAHAARSRSDSPRVARRVEGRSARTCTTTTSSGPRSRKWNNN